jgi:hypothetical protein
MSATAFKTTRICFLLLRAFSKQFAYILDTIPYLAKVFLPLPGKCVPHSNQKERGSRHKFSAIYPFQLMDIVYINTSHKVNNKCMILKLANIPLPIFFLFRFESSSFSRLGFVLINRLLVRNRHAENPRKIVMDAVGGTGGKQLRPRRRVGFSRTPYDRPLVGRHAPPELRNPNSNGGGSWFSKLLSPIANGAGRLLSSVFRRQESAETSSSYSSSTDDEDENSSGNYFFIFLKKKLAFQNPRVWSNFKLQYSEPFG